MDKYPQFSISTKVTSLLVPILVKDFGKRSITQEFDMLNEATYDDQYISKLVKDGCYKSKNRYVDILPYNHSIVKLDDKELSPSNYINGNYLHNPLFPQFRKSFILTQGPLDNTVGCFWRMISNENVKNILCIVEHDSLGSRCAKYWPETNMKTELYEIEASSTDKNKLFHKKELSLRNPQDKSTKNVQHFHIFNWIDFSTLTGDDINALLNLIKNLYEEQSKNFSPIVVHCSAGVGRSGTFAAVYFAYEYWRYCQAQGKEFRISIFDLVLKMRGMRYGLVQTAQQYKFIYKLVSMFK